MTQPKGRSTVVRTGDGIRYEVPLSEGSYPRDVAGQGELIRSGPGLAEAIDRLALSFRHGLEQSRANKMSATFGLSLHPDAGFIVSQGTDQAHFVITVEFDTDGMR